MKSTTTLPQLLTIALLLLLSSCKKDDDLSSFIQSHYLFLEKLEVGVVPEDRTVQVLFQAMDHLQKGVGDLTVDEFEVYENQGKLDSEANIRVGRSSIPYELKTVLLLDITASVKEFIPEIKAARGL